MEKLRDTIERLAREWADATPSMVTRQGMVEHYTAAMTELLTDPDVGFKEALECVLDKQVSKGYNNVEEMLAGEDNEEYKECMNCLSNHRDFDTGEFIEGSPCSCPCHTASAKLAELKELSK